MKSDPTGHSHMKVRTVSCLAAFAALLAACVPAEYSFPIVGKLSSGVAAAGQGTSRSTGEGVFWVQVPGEYRCDGTYNALDRSPSFVIPVRCSNGLRGQVVVAMQQDRYSGTAILKLSNGQRGQFVFGRLTYEQAFGQGGIARASQF